jgi:hypothetical protein
LKLTAFITGEGSFYFITGKEVLLMTRKIILHESIFLSITIGTGSRAYRNKDHRWYSDDLSWIRSFQRQGDE